MNHEGRRNYALDRNSTCKVWEEDCAEEPTRVTVRDTVRQVMGHWVLITHGKVWNRATWQGLLLIKFYWNVATLVYGCFCRVKCLQLRLQNLQS